MINLEDYELIQPTSIQRIENDIKKFIDIEVEDDNTFHIHLEKSDSNILTHNCDGDSIVGMLLNFFSRWEEVFDMDMIYRVITPLLVIKKGKEKKYFYTDEEWSNYKASNSLHGWEVFFKKGLGSLNDEEYSDMIKNPKTIQIHWDNDAMHNLKTWFGDDSSLRKDKLM